MTKVEVLDAVVDGHGKGAVIVIDDRSASYLASIGYVRILEVEPEQKTPVSVDKTEGTEKTEKAETKPKQSRKKK
jgi:hypothetical protein